jgi:hypothetical protein
LLALAFGAIARAQDAVPLVAAALEPAVDASTDAGLSATESVIPEEREHVQPALSDLGLKVTTNFLERELRGDYAQTSIANSPTQDSTDFANVLMAYALNRRLMLEVIRRGCRLPTRASARPRRP